MPFRFFVYVVNLQVNQIRHFFSIPNALPLIIIPKVEGPSFVDKRKREEIKMEAIEAETIKREDSPGNCRFRCYFCKKWVAFDVITDVRRRQEIPCPHCGETGKELREKEKKVLQALSVRQS